MYTIVDRVSFNLHGRHGVLDSEVYHHIRHVVVVSLRLLEPRLGQIVIARSTVDESNLEAGLRGEVTFRLEFLVTKIIG